MFWRKKKKFNLYQDEIEFLDNEEDLVSEEKPKEDIPADDIEENTSAESAFSGEDVSESEDVSAADTFAGGETPAADTFAQGETPTADTFAQGETPTADTYVQGETPAADTFAGGETPEADIYAQEDNPAEYMPSDEYDTFAVGTDTSVDEVAQGDDPAQSGWFQVKDETTAKEESSEDNSAENDWNQDESKTAAQEEFSGEDTVQGGWTLNKDETATQEESSDDHSAESDWNQNDNEAAADKESSEDDSVVNDWIQSEDDAAAEEKLTGEDAEAGEDIIDGELPEDQDTEGEAGEDASLTKEDKKKDILARFSIPFGKKRKHDKSSKDNDDEALSDEPEWKKTKEKKLTRKKIAAIAIGSVVVIGVAVFFIMRLLGGGDESKAYVESVAEITGLGTANGMSNRYTGEVEAQDSWKITLQQDLSVSECYVHVGDEVKEGDKLFSYNTEELKLNKEKKELEVETLTNEINQLKKDIVEYQNDLKNANASEKIELQTQILTAQTTIKKDEFTIKSSKDDIESLEKNIKDATITSKMTGVVKKINASLGSSSGDDSDDSGVGDGSGDDAYMTILALGSYRVKGKISETNVWQINEGDPVIVRSRVDENQTWKGSIEQVKTDTNAESDSQNSDDLDYDLGDSGGESASNYNFFVKLDDDSGLMMGQHVLIEIDKGQDDDKTGIWLNSAYLHIDGDNYYVWLSNKKDRLNLRKVEVGEYNEELDEYEVLSGLALTDFIAADSEELHENMRTTKVNPEDSTEFDVEEENDDSLNDENFDSDEGNDDFMFEDESDSSSDDDAIVIDDGQGLGPDKIDDSDQNSL